MAGCPKCEAKGQTAKPKREKTVAKAAEPESKGTFITFEQLQALMSGNTDAMQQFARTLGEELRKPDPEEVAKREAEKARFAERKRIRMVEIGIDEQAKRDQWAACARGGHKKENGQSAVNLGQVHADDCYHPRCYRCFFEFPVVKARASALEGTA